MENGVLVDKALLDAAIKLIVTGTHQCSFLDVSRIVQGLQAAAAPKPREPIGLKTGLTTKKK